MNHPFPKPMMRVPLVAKPILTVMLLLMATGNVCAQNDKSQESDTPTTLQYQRVFVPDSQPELWPTQNVRHIPVPEAEFQKLLDATNRDLPKTFFSSPEVKITSADYEAELEILNLKESKKTYRIKGKARLRVATSAKTGLSDPRFLSLGPASMVVKNLVWIEDKSPVPTGVDKHGRLIAQIDRSGELQFDFAARDRSNKPGELRFDLTLPRSTRSSTILSLDSTWNVSVSSGLLLDRNVLGLEASSSSDSRRTRWTIAPTLDGQLCFLLTKQKDSSALSEIPDVFESMLYDFSPRGLELRGELRLTTNGPMLPASLRIELEKPLTLISARLGSKPLKWSAQSKDGQTTILLELPESRPRSATLRLWASCAISENEDWKLPRIIPQKVFWRSGEITLRVNSPLSIGKLAPCKCVRTKIEELSQNEGRLIRLTPFRRNATAVISLGWEKHAPTLSFGTIVDLSGVDISATQSLLFTPSVEEVFELRAAVNSGWIIDSVESNASGIIADWRVEASKTKKAESHMLIIRLSSALSKRHGPLRLTLTARCLQSPLGRRLGLKDFMPVEFHEVRQAHRLISVATVDPYSVVYRGEEFVDSLSIKSLSAEQGTLFSKIPVGKIFLDNARAARMEIVLESQKPAYAAAVEMILTLTKEKLTERYRFRCVPEASHIDRLLIHLSGEEDENTGQEKEKGTLHFLPKPMTSSFIANQPDILLLSDEQTFLTLSPKSFSVIRLSLEEQAAIGMGASGQTWEITLKSPQNEPFEFYAVRSQDYAKTRETVLPMTICPSLAAMPEAIEHRASLQIETTDDTSLWLHNLRLEPIPITPTNPLKIQQLRAAFRYETTDSLASPSDPALCLTLDKPGRNSLLAWKCVVQTEYGSDGSVRASVRYNLENQGETRFRLLIPETNSPLKIDAVSLDGKYVDWTPEYSDKTKTNPASQPASICIDLPCTKRFPSVTVHYSYRIERLGTSQLRSLIAPKPTCEVVSIDWHFLLPPGYKAFDYVAINNLPPKNAFSNKNKTFGQGTVPLGVDSALSLRQTVCWRTCLFGPLGRSTSDLPFNPLSLESWSRFFGGLESKTQAAESDPVKSSQQNSEREIKNVSTSQAVSKTKVENYHEWNLYQVRYSSFDRTTPLRIVHHDSIEVFRWTAFLVTIALVAWPRSARWIRRLPIAVAAALLALFMSPLISALASGVLMGVLVALLAIWFFKEGHRERHREGHRQSRFRKPTPPDRIEGLLSATARSIPASTSGSTQASPAAHIRPATPEASKEGDATSAEISNGTSIELGKTISDKTTPPKRPGGSTIIRRTTMFWGLLAGIFLSSGVDAVAFFDNPTISQPSHKSSYTDVSRPTTLNYLKNHRPKSSIQWPILIPIDSTSKTSTRDEPMLYLPEPFFRELEALARRQTVHRDLWLLKDASLRVILDRDASDKTLHPTFLFLRLEVSVFSQEVEVEISLKKEQVQLKKTLATLDGRPVSPRWSEDGKSLIVPIAGLGTHQLELLLAPQPESYAARWNVQEQRDESGFRIDFPRFSQIKLELNHPSDMAHPTIDGLISSTEENSTTIHATVSSEGQLAVWWPEERSKPQSKVASKFDSLLMLDITPDAVTLQANWSLASEQLDTSSKNKKDDKTKKRNKNLSVVAGRNRTTNQLRDVILSVDPQLVLQEITSGFTLRPIPGSSGKRRLYWNKVTDPPKSVHAKFLVEKTRGIGQFHAPALRIDQGQTVRHWLAVRVAPSLRYQVDFSKPSSPPNGQSSLVPTITPEAFMATWQEKLVMDPKRNGLTETDENQTTSSLPNFVVADQLEAWSFRTEPKPTDATVVHQTLRVSFGETSTWIRFDAEWSSGSHDMPEPSLRVPKNFKIDSAFLIDNGTRQDLQWSCTKEGFVHLATGLLPPKRRTVRIEGTLVAIDTSRPVALPIISLIGAEETPLYVGIYRKSDALLTLEWKKLPVDSEPPEHITDGWFQGQLVQWLKQKPLEETAADVRITPNRPTIRARQAVTIVPSTSTFSRFSNVSTQNGSENSEKETNAENQQHDMIAAFELTPKGGVIDEIAIFVPHSVVGPFRTDPTLSLVRSHENEKGQTIIFQPKEPIKKWYQFRLSSPMNPGETRIPDVKLCEIDNLDRYIVLPADTGDTQQRQWQTRLLNREADQAILGKLMPIESGAQLYRVVGRQWLAIASTAELSDQQPTVSLANIQVRWQKDGSYLASAVFDLKPFGNESCRLIIPHGLTLLDARIAGIPTSPVKITSNTEEAAQQVVNAKAYQTLRDAYTIHFTSKTHSQRVELLYRHNPLKKNFGQELASQSRVLRKDFQTPFLDVKIQQTRWTVQGPDTYTIQGEFDATETDSELLNPLEEFTPEETLIASLTPFLTEQASLGEPVQWTVEGFSGQWKTVWLSKTSTPLTILAPTAFVLLLIGTLAFIRPVQATFRLFLYRHRPLFGIAFGLFWWLFLTPSIFGWVIIIAFLIVTYRARNAHPQDNSTAIPIG